MAILRVEAGTDSPSEVRLEKDRFEIGRGTGNDLHLNNRWLSRSHARIERRGDDHVIVDLGSRNGTTVNDEPLRGERLLASGDLITLGDLRLRYLRHRSAFRVDPSRLPLQGSRTMVLGTDQLSLERYRAEQAAAAAAGRAGDDFLPALNAVAAALITHYPLEELVRVVIDLARQAVPAERAALLLRSRDSAGELEIEATHGYGEGQEVRISRTIIEEVLEQRKAVLTVDAASDERFGQAHSILIQGITSILCVPLWDNEQVIGLLYLDSRIARATFGERDLRLAALIANLAAVKIQNVLLLDEQLEKRRMEEQLALGAKIQRGLLPSEDPTVPGYDIAGANRSCYEIGGDYYDYVRREDGRWSLVIADISGKGVGAALLMAVLQASFRTLVRTGARPAALMAQLNEVLIENSPSNKFATVFYAELDPAGHRLEYVNGGHNPGLFYDPRSGTVQELGATGPLVGLVPAAAYVSRDLELPPGSRLLLYTDGVTEMEDAAGEELGTAPLVELLRHEPRATSGDLLAAIRLRLAELAAGAPAADDTTVVAVRREE